MTVTKPAVRRIDGALRIVSSFTCIIVGLSAPHLASTAELHLADAEVLLGHRELWPAMGASMAWVGDTDGDGVEELLLGAPYAREGLGEALVVHGGALGPHILPGPALVASYRREVREGIELGMQVSAAGDADGDGTMDIWVHGDGVAYLLSGSHTGIVQPQSEALATVFGVVRLVGGVDLSGDGVPDLVIGTGEGVFVLDGPFSGTPIHPETSARLEIWHSYADCEDFGDIIEVGGDLDGDGHRDLLVGATNRYPMFCDVRRRVGFVRADLAGRIDLYDEADARATAIVDTSVKDVALVGDVNGDGFDDLMVSHRLYEVPVLWGPFTSDIVDIDTTPGAIIKLPVRHASASSVRGAGDIDGDGLADLAFAASAFDYDTVFVVPGSAVGLEDWMTPSLRLILPPGVEIETEGGLLAGHDSDGDGIPELVIATGAKHGQVFVVKGATMAGLLP